MGGKIGAPENEINFYDYDGFRVASYTIEEANQLSTMPEALPHDHLIFKEWNYDLSDIKNTRSPMDIGATYDTVGDSMYIKVNTPIKNTTFYISFRTLDKITVDWGDGKTDLSEKIDANIPFSHVYDQAGTYWVQISSDKDVMINTWVGFTEDEQHSLNYIEEIYLPKLKGIAPEKYSLPTFLFQSLVLPSNIIDIHHSSTPVYLPIFYSIPKTVTEINTTFKYIKNISIPKNVTKIKKGLFEGNNYMNHIYLSDSLQILPTDSLRHIRCSYIKMPKNVTTIESYAFFESRSALFDFSESQVVPTLASNSFSSLRDVAKILVPKALEEEWKAAPNWSTYASYIVGV